MLSSFLGCSPDSGGNGKDLLNVSYEPTHELYVAVNRAFTIVWEKQTGQRVTIHSSHGASGKQARAVIDGLRADVVSLALAYDIDAMSRKADLLAADWRKRFPNGSCPYTSTIVLLVRKGNPKGIKDWDDLAKAGLGIVTPNPQTSGGARWNYLAAWGYALRRELGDLKKLSDRKEREPIAAAQTKAREFLQRVLKNVVKFDVSAGAAANTFIGNKMGDVLLAWENEALAAAAEKPDEVEIVIPSVSILAEPPVAVVDAVVDQRGTRALAEGYLKFLYTPEGQRLIAEHYYRPSSAEIAEKYRARFAQVELFTIEDVFGGWQKAQREHFEEGGIFDQIQEAIRKR
jgi:sulfate transport system substrate-binding protein